MSVITQEIVNELGIKPISMTQVHGVAGITTRPVFLVSLLLPMGVQIRMLNVTLGDLPPGSDALIGMDVILLGDLVISNRGGNTKMSFRIPSVGDWDFVKSGNPNVSRAERRAQEKKARRRR